MSRPGGGKLSVSNNRAEDSRGVLFTVASTTEEADYFENNSRKKKLSKWIKVLTMVVASANDASLFLWPVAR